MSTFWTDIRLGVALALAAYLCFTSSDAIVKGLGATNLSVFEIGLVVTAFAMLPGLLVKPKAHRWRDTFRMRRPWLVQFGGATRAMASLLGIYSFVSIPFAEVYCIVFLIPVIISILSVFVLKEDVSLTRWLLIAVSFAGVLLVVRPGFKTLELGHITALGCAFCTAISIVTVRMVSAGEQRLVLFLTPFLYTLFANLVGVAIVGIAWPSWPQFAALVLSGLLGGVAYFLQISALHRAPASRVSPMQYSQIVWALVFGALFFSEVPDALALLGLAVIVLSGVANIAADNLGTRVATLWRRRPGAI